LFTKLTNETFKIKGNLVHSNFYDYSLVNYINGITEIEIICPLHGIFKQIPKTHLSGHNCPECGKINKSNKLKSDKEKFIIKANKKHNFLYDYSLSNYIDSETKIEIICKKHGMFEQKPNNHIQGQKCPKCQNNLKSNNEIFIKKANIIHSNKYEYSSSDYINNKIEIDIRCQIHGIFKQRPDVHLQGQGCPYCNESKGEKLIKKILENNNIKFKVQKRFNNCRYIKPLPFDFYLYEKNICIEYDGIQHFEPRERFGGIKTFLEQQKRDEIKNNYCKNNNINLIRISYLDNIQDKLSFIL
jgi:very-short-patch-repair endonuclease